MTPQPKLLIAPLGLCLLLMACGTLEVGIERTLTPVSVVSTPTPVPNNATLSAAVTQAGATVIVARLAQPTNPTTVAAALTQYVATRDAVSTAWPAKAPTATSTPTATYTLAPTLTPLPSVTPSSNTGARQCATSFERRELKEPYQGYDGQARYTLSTEELNGYLAVMGIESLCIPVELGAPFLRLDWDSNNQELYATGRMFSLSFESRGVGYILYATYDFSIGSEYETFATLKDWEAIRNNTVPDVIEVNGVKGLIRIKPFDPIFEMRSVYKTFVFPFETYYVAVVSALGPYDANTDWEIIIQESRAGKYLPNQQDNVQAMDFLASTIRFRSQSQP